jgi:hypothetical protein
MQIKETLRLGCKVLNCSIYKGLYRSFTERWKNRSGRCSEKSSSDFDFAIARMNADGSLDKTFNSVGYTLIDFGGYDQATHVDIWGDKIIVVGYSIVSKEIACSKSA